MRRIYYLLLFLLLNFGALALGTLLMNSGPTSAWYLELSKDPWTPPGWVFGVAWTSIMLFFSFYMTALVRKSNTSTVFKLYAVQLLLNISWNWVFFNKHKMFASELILISLTVIVGLLMFRYRKQMRYLSLLILPYFLWLLVANSLNIYTILYN